MQVSAKSKKAGRRLLGQAKSSSGTKMLNVMTSLGELGRDGEVRLMDVVKLTGYPQPTVHRLLTQLKQAGFVTQQVSGPYRLGPKILTLAAQCLGGLEVRQIAASTMQAFCEKMGHTVHLAIADNVEVVYIAKTEPFNGLRIGSTVGQRRPIPVTALGKAILAFSSQALLARVLEAGWEKRTANTLRSTAALERQLTEIRRAGYAIDDEESDLGLRCAAAPIFNHEGLPTAALSVTTLTSRVSYSQLVTLGSDLAREANAISEKLGWQPPGV